jgi:hypothetical protein
MPTQSQNSKGETFLLDNENLVATTPVLNALTIFANGYAVKIDHPIITTAFLRFRSLAYSVNKKSAMHVQAEKIAVRAISGFKASLLLSENSKFIFLKHNVVVNFPYCEVEFCAILCEANS